MYGAVIGTRTLDSVITNDGAFNPQLQHNRANEKNLKPRAGQAVSPKIHSVRRGLASCCAIEQRAVDRSFYHLAIRDGAGKHTS
jgi:hypothetical protein